MIQNNCFWWVGGCRTYTGAGLKDRLPTAVQKSFEKTKFNFMQKRVNKRRPNLKRRNLSQSFQVSTHLALITFGWWMLKQPMLKYLGLHLSVPLCNFMLILVKLLVYHLLIPGIPTQCNKKYQFCRVSIYLSISRNIC